MRPVVAIRPEPGLSSTLAKGRALGLEMHGFPLSRAEPVEWQAPDPARFDALLIGSANAIRHGGEQLDLLKRLPVHAVGAATADAAKAAGFVVAQTGEGGLQNVLDHAAKPLSYLRLSGEARVDLAVPDGSGIEERVVYRMADLEFPEGAKTVLEQGPTVLLHSAGQARQFCSECNRLNLPSAIFSIAALGPRIAAAAGEGWRTIHVAERPDDDHLLAMVKRLCL